MTMIGYSVNYVATSFSLATLAQWHRERKSMEARSCNFWTATKLGKERLWMLEGSNVPQNYSKIKIIAAKNSP